MKKKSPGASAPKSPSLSSPGADLPAEVLDAAGAPSVREKQRAREEAEMFSMLRRELGSSGFVTLSRSHQNWGHHKPAHVGTMAADDFTIERVTEIYGGGDFIAKGRTAGGTFTEERRFSIDHTIPPKNPKTPAGEKAAPAAPPIDAAAIMREAREAAREGTATMLEMIKSFAPAPGKAGETLEMFKFLAEQQEKSATQLREMIAKSEERTARILEKLATREAAPVAAPRSLIEQLEEAKELVDMIGGGGKDSGGDWKKELIGLAREAAPLIAQRMQFAGSGPNGFPPNAMQPVLMRPGPALVSTGAPGTAAPAGAPGQPAPAAIPISVTPLPNGEPAAADPNSDMMLQFALNRFRSSAIAAARKNKDPYDFILSTLDLVPPEYYGRIFESAKSADWFTQFFTADPEATQHIKFLTDVRESILARALVSHAAQFAAVNKAPAETAMQFAGWVPEDARDSIYNWTDVQNWSVLFEGAETLGGGAPLDAVWLETLRVELEKVLGGEPAQASEAQVKPAEPAAAKPAQSGKPKATRKTA